MLNSCSSAVFAVAAFQRLGRPVAVGAHGEHGQVEQAQEEVVSFQLAWGERLCAPPRPRPSLAATASRCATASLRHRSRLLGCTTASLDAMEPSLFAWAQEALSNHLHESAIFVAERLVAEANSERNRHLLATCYYASGAANRAASILQARASSENRVTCSR